MPYPYDGIFSIVFGLYMIFVRNWAVYADERFNKWLFKWFFKFKYNKFDVATGKGAFVLMGIFFVVFGVLRILRVW